VKQEAPLSFRIEPELHTRLTECSERLRLKKYTLALMALEAAVEAIEKNDYRLVLPIQFEVAHVAVEKTSSSSNSPSRSSASHEGEAKKRKAG
jgi:predicted DNA-binding protein